MYPSLPPLAPHPARLDYQPRCSCDLINVNSGNFLVDAHQLCLVHGFSHTQLPSLRQRVTKLVGQAKEAPVKLRKRRLSWETDSTCAYLCKLIEANARTLSKTGRRRLQILHEAWQSDQDRPEGAVPSARALGKHMRRETHRGRAHACARAYEAYRRGAKRAEIEGAKLQEPAEPTVKRARLIIRIPAAVVRRWHAQQADSELTVSCDDN